MLGRWVVRSLCYILTLTAIPALLCQSKLNELAGVVTSQSGEPLAGVIIRADAKDYKTDESGHYRVQLPSGSIDFCCVVQFRREGYKTLTKAVDPATGVLDITLQSGESKWTPPEWNPSDSKRIGAQMRFLTPRGAKVTRGSDVDYWEIAVGFGSSKNREWMRIGGGANWSSGLPLISDMASVIDISERDMVCGINGIDIRGHTKDDKRWRFTGMWGETVTYRDASEEAAKFFDAIIDGLSCDWEVLPGMSGRLTRKR